MMPEKSIIKLLSSMTVFNIDANKNCFLSSKSVYDFQRIMWHKTEVMMLKIQLYHQKLELNYN